MAGRGSGGFAPFLLCVLRRQHWSLRRQSKRLLVGGLFVRAGCQSLRDRGIFLFFSRPVRLRFSRLLANLLLGWLLVEFLLSLPLVASFAATGFSLGGGSSLVEVSVKVRLGLYCVCTLENREGAGKG